jgi:hypothetical protein
MLPKNLMALLLSGTLQKGSIIHLKNGPMQFLTNACKLHLVNYNMLEILASPHATYSFVV